MGTHRASVLNQVGPYFEMLKPGGTEGVTDGDIRGIASTRDYEPADTSRIVPRIEDVPFAVQEDFHARREVHGRVRAWHTNVPEVGRDIAGRNTHGAAECDRQMSEVLAESNVLLLQSTVKNREVYPQTAALGRTVFDVRGIRGAKPAKDEMRALYEEIVGLLSSEEEAETANG